MRDCENCKHRVMKVEVGKGTPPEHFWGCECWECEFEPTTKNDLGVDCISRQAVIDGIKEYFHDEYYQRTSIQDCRDCFIEDVLNHLPSVTPQEPCNKCEVGNPCLYCKHEFEPQESED